MRINSTPQFKSLGNATPGGQPPASHSKLASGASDFYNRHPQLTHMAGGALLDRPGSSRGTASGGFHLGCHERRDLWIFCGRRQGPGPTNGRIQRRWCRNAAVAGCPAATIVGAAGTGAIVGWLLTHFPRTK